VSAAWFAKAPKRPFAARNAFKKVCPYKGLILLDVLVLLGSPMITMECAFCWVVFGVADCNEQNPLISAFPV
jgi:hypothetical protein